MHNVLLAEQVAHLRNMEFSSWHERLRYAVSISGVSQAALAREIDLPQTNVSQILSGRQKSVSLTTALRFAKFLGLSVEEIFPDLHEPSVEGQAQQATSQETR